MPFPTISAGQLASAAIGGYANFIAYLNAVSTAVDASAKKADNLSDLTSASTARTNLGLGTAAVTNTGTGASNTILGNDARLSDTRTPTDGSVTVAKLATNAAYASAQSINAQTGTTYTLVIGDVGKLITLSNGSAITLTVPPNADVAFDVGARIDLIQVGAGQVTVAQGSGVTVSSTPTLKSRAQYSGMSLIKTGTNQWYLVGDLAAS